MKTEHFGDKEFMIVRNLPEKGSDWHNIRVMVDNSEDSFSAIMSQDNTSLDDIVQGTPIMGPVGFMR